MTRLILPAAVWEHTLRRPRPCAFCGEKASLSFTEAREDRPGEAYCSLAHWGKAADERVELTGTMTPARPRVQDAPFQAQRWRTITRHWPECGEPGITATSRAGNEVLLYRDEAGKLAAALTHLPDGQLNVMVAPSHRHRGIGRALVRAAGRRWPINLADQRMTNAGRGLVRRIDPRGPR